MKSEGSCLMAEQKTDKTEVRAMWIMVAVVVLIIVAGTGWNMWTHPDWIHGN
jgi:heme/copper-type cytochrome/quinol oxidase subunit 4